MAGAPEHHQAGWAGQGGGRGKMWANKWSGARLFGLEEATFSCTFELFSQGLPLPPTQETNTETGLFSVAPVAEGDPGKAEGQGHAQGGSRRRWAGSTGGR